MWHTQKAYLDETFVNIFSSQKNMYDISYCTFFLYDHFDVHPKIMCNTCISSILVWNSCTAGSNPCSLSDGVAPLDLALWESLCLSQVNPSPKLRVLTNSPFLFSTYWCKCEKILIVPAIVEGSSWRTPRFICIIMNIFRTTQLLSGTYKKELKVTAQKCSFD